MNMSSENIFPDCTGRLLLYNWKVKNNRILPVTEKMSCHN